MAVNTSATYLKYALSSAPTEFLPLVEIINYPDLGSTPSKLDTTTLSAKKFKTSINGLQELPDFTFEALYTKDDYVRISALTEVYKFKLEFGDDGEDGAFTWDGKISVYPIGAGVDEVRKMQLTLSVETEIVPVTA